LNLPESAESFSFPLPLSPVDSIPAFFVMYEHASAVKQTGSEHACAGICEHRARTHIHGPGAASSPVRGGLDERKQSGMLRMGSQLRDSYEEM
jgi:hypothetical protein